MKLTSLPGAMSLSATRFNRGSLFLGVLEDLGKTTTALGLHEWFANAITGATLTPIGAREGEVRVKVFVVNCE